MSRKALDEFTEVKIQVLFKTGAISHVELARAFGVSTMVIWRTIKKMAKKA